MKTKLQKNIKGFTIIEVLIVLAIAGLILLIVFLAVPALQRNNRNTQRKAGVSALLGAVGEHVSNNNGALPTQAQVQDLSNVSYYADAPGTGQGEWSLAAGPTGATTVTADNDRAHILTAATCVNATEAGEGPARGYVVVYGIEQQGGTFASSCVAS